MRKNNENIGRFHRIPIREGIIGVLVLLLAACASIGTPDGGRYDEEPPYVVKSNPGDRATGVTTKKIRINFNEYIKLDNASEKVVISPAQLEPANVRADGKQIRVDLFDSLKANTTYTIDFSDAVEDNNEGNPMGNYTFSFSTGDVIDTMEISGNVVAASNLEPVKGSLVGVIPYDSTWHDSLFRTTPLLRLGRTNGSGRFTIKGIKPGRYRCFALKDGDGNFRFSQKSEEIAFDTTVIVPTVFDENHSDTIWRDSLHIDTIFYTPRPKYGPSDIILRSFLEEGQERHFLKSERQEPNWFKLYFTAPLDSLPMVRGLNFDEKQLVVLTVPTNDTITYWFTDTAFVHNQDTARIEMTYMESDTLGGFSQKIDTLELVPKTLWSKLQKQMQRKVEEWEKRQEKRVKQGKLREPERTRPDVVNLKFKITPSTSIDPNRNVRITIEEPLAEFNEDAVHFQKFNQKDSIWENEPYILQEDPYNPMAWTLYADWLPREEYKVSIDTLAARSILGHRTHPANAEMRVRSLDDYGTLFMHIKDPDTGFVVQLIDKNDKVLYTARSNEKGDADFFYLTPGSYYVRAFLDVNGNDVWDTGDYDACRQPEEVFYFPQPLKVRAMWDIEQDWEPRGIPILQQKPQELVKQKADKVKFILNRNEERERQKQNKKK
ncbi:MAG: Ig-like domain-containing protein [Bacteroidaceae bacterium]|nr:Ig-like domain-containing protein [Bacteroidaceae bacterium]